METTGGDHEGPASPRERTSAQGGPEPALEQDNSRRDHSQAFAFKIYGDAQNVYDMPAETTNTVTTMLRKYSTIL